MKGGETGKQPRNRGRFQEGGAKASRKLCRTLVLVLQHGALEPGGPGLSPPRWIWDPG